MIRSEVPALHAHVSHRCIKAGSRVGLMASADPMTRLTLSLKRCPGWSVDPNPNLAPTLTLTLIAILILGQDGAPGRRCDE